MNSLLAKAYCETDAAWDAYCCAPTQSTWELYVEAKRNESQLEASIKDNRASKKCISTEEFDE